MQWITDHLIGSVFWTLLLIIHGLVSVALLGAITHQVMAALSTKKILSKDRSFIDEFRAVNAAKYSRAICWLWCIAFLLGGWIYTEYRINVRIPIEQQEFYLTLGSFELKEHLAVLGLAMLPIYRFAWKHYDNMNYESLRKGTTVFLAFVCWYAFLIGHIVNNVRGYGS
jgi:hypothetical protein